MSTCYYKYTRFTDNFRPFTDWFFVSQKCTCTFGVSFNSINLKIMKMGAGVFWGGLLIFIGLALIIRFVFNVDFPVFKVLIAGFFIYLGFTLLHRSFHL